jgi:hopanoid biosynthesis associated protein HpnK
MKNTKKRDILYQVIVADDLGRSSSVNAAIAEAHDRGIVTATSLMAKGDAFEEAVQMAAQRSRLSVGLHVTFCDGRAVLRPSYIPDLVDKDGRFEKSPEKAWIKCMKPGVLSQIEAEVEAQFDRLEKVGIKPTHVDGHHHLQMHPLIFEAICKHAAKRGVGWIRIPNEAISIVLSSRSFSRGVMPLIEGVVFGVLRTYNLRTAAKYRINVARNCMGLSWTGSIDEQSLLELLGMTEDPVSEIFTHPDMATDRGRKELEALTSVKARKKLAFLGIELAGYRELSGREFSQDSVWERNINKRSYIY